jgi:hypothetical protein
MMNIYTLLEVAVVGVLCCQLQSRAVLRFAILAILLCYSMLWFYVIFAFGLSTDNSLINGGEAISCISIIIISLAGLVGNSRLSSIPGVDVILGGFLAYFVLSAGIFSFTRFFSIASNREVIIYFAGIHFVANVTLNLSLARGIVIWQRRSLLGSS